MFQGFFLWVIFCVAAGWGGGGKQLRNLSLFFRFQRTSNLLTKSPLAVHAFRLSEDYTSRIVRRRGSTHAHGYSAGAAVVAHTAKGERTTCVHDETGPQPQLAQKAEVPLPLLATDIKLILIGALMLVVAL